MLQLRELAQREWSLERHVTLRWRKFELGSGFVVQELFFFWLEPDGEA